MIRETTPEQRERIDFELANPGHEQKKIESHPAVQKNPELGLRLHYQKLIKTAATETRKNELARELGEKLLAMRQGAEG